jgi:hypothetical protein
MTGVTMGPATGGGVISAWLTSDVRASRPPTFMMSASPSTARLNDVCVSGPSGTRVARAAWLEALALGRIERPCTMRSMRAAAARVPPAPSLASA